MHDAAPIPGRFDDDDILPIPIVDLADDVPEPSSTLALEGVTPADVEFGELPAPIVTGETPAKLLPLWLGLGLCLLLAVIAGYAATYLREQGLMLGTLTIALLIGVVIGNVAPKQTDSCVEGVAFAKRSLLRLGIVLYGFRLTLASFAEAGVAILAIDAIVVVATFAIAMWAGVRWLRLDTETSALIGAGASICGASAVLATAPVVGAKPAQAAIAISTVAVFGTVALLLYPLLFRANLDLGWIPDGAHGFGVFIGSTVHEVGQVVAIANASSADATGAAVVTKMGRVAMLLPFLIGVAYWRGGRTDLDGRAQHWSRSMPWFPVLFAVAVVVNSVAPVENIRPTLQRLDELALATAMVALGLATRFSALKEAGPKPLMLAGVLFAWLVIGGAALNAGISALARML